MVDPRSLRKGDRVYWYRSGRKLTGTISRITHDSIVINPDDWDCYGIPNVEHLHKLDPLELLAEVK